MGNADETPAAQHRFFVLVVQVVVGNTHPVHQGAYRQQFAPTLGAARSVDQRHRSRGKRDAGAQRRFAFGDVPQPDAGACFVEFCSERHGFLG